MKNKEYRPFKLVHPEETNFRTPNYSGGGPQKIFGDFEEEDRNELNQQVDQVRQHFLSVFKRTPNLPCVARFKLKEKALAKSHRPRELFEKSACRVIGTDNFGELLVTVNSDVLDRLSGQIQRLKTNRGIANLSTIARIDPYRITDQMGELGLQDLVAQIRSGTNLLRFRLFRHGDAKLDELLLNEFYEVVQDLGSDNLSRIRYSDTLDIYRLKGVDEEMFLMLSQFVGTREISAFPTYCVHPASVRNIHPLTNQEFPPPRPNREYPVIGIVDSGIDASNEFLEPWVVDREIYVVGENDCAHGTFVGALAVHARRLNGDVADFTDQSSKLLDVVAIPESGEITEDALLSILEDVVLRHPEVKVWNLSLSQDNPCSGQAFSRIGIALDAIQDQHAVTFVIASGNLTSSPLRGWPSTVSGEKDRIAPPADSVRCISVGSITHCANENSLVGEGEPSPFSRRGPGPVYLPIPELTHVGGNCDESGDLFDGIGVLSVGLGEMLVENIGTSFATPQVATELANIEAMLEGALSRNLQRALLIHSAVCRSQDRSALERNYYGFGVPGDMVNLLSGDPWSISLVFQANITPGIEYEHSPFPFPQCLRKPDGRLFGEILMTLVYDPPLDSEYASEYCRSNVDVSLGTYTQNDKGKWIHTKQIPLDPPKTSHWYEQEQIEHGYKWSPVKVYRRHIVRGVLGEDWRLKVTTNYRSEFTTDKSQGFVLVMTIRDPEHQQPVYDQTIARMRELNWRTQDLQIRGRTQTFV